MARFIPPQPQPANCPVCNAPAQVHFESPVYHDHDPLAFKPPVMTVHFLCNCRRGVSINNFSISTPKEPTVTEKQYDIDPAKNTALRAVDNHVKGIERILLKNRIELEKVEAQNATRLRENLANLDGVLLDAGQAGVKNADIDRAIPEDRDWIKERIAVVWNVVSFAQIDETV